MPSTALSPLARAALLGVLSGARSATPFAGLALARDSRTVIGSWQEWALFRSPIGRVIAVAAGAGELVGDKLPSTPSRVAGGALFGRIAAGAVVGLAMGTTQLRADRRLQGALVGAAGALVGSFAGYLGRKAVVERTGLPDLAVALVEDALTVGGTAAVLRAPRR
ncbi:DUF4126 family protein [Frigoribacterium faeni]|uniref:DUF4126 family protein n=1 Tax=Frigoribacterium faeni TaxID=145483 RepID=UPI00141A785B|nr:DUF4126 family protein [Frigoribacterium faeni]NIJ05906.1 putative membrane protein [Frigoribacterium faeni]